MMLGDHERNLGQVLAFVDLPPRGPTQLCFRAPVVVPLPRDGVVVANEPVPTVRVQASVQQGGRQPAALVQYLDEAEHVHQCAPRDVGAARTRPRLRYPWLNVRCVGACRRAACFVRGLRPGVGRRRPSGWTPACHPAAVLAFREEGRLGRRVGSWGRGSSTTTDWSPKSATTVNRPPRAST